MRSLGPPYYVDIDPTRHPEAWQHSLRMQVHTDTLTLTHSHTHSNTHTNTRTERESART
jgi:hypothetical protein